MTSLSLESARSRSPSPRPSISTSTLRLSKNNSRHSHFDDRTFAEIGIQTETTLSLTADIAWTPTITSVIVERNIDTYGMSILDRAIFAQECDELPSVTEQQWEMDSDDTEDAFESRGDEAEEETEDVAEEELEPISVANRI